MDGNTDYSINEKIYLQWIDWCHQRQLSFSALSITLVISLFEIVTKFSNFIIASFLYFGVAFLLLFNVKALAYLELDILNYQYKLYQSRNEWDIYYKKSGSKWLFELDDKNIKIKKMRIYLIYIFAACIFLTIYAGLFIDK